MLQNRITLNIEGKEEDLELIEDLEFTDKAGPELDYIPMDGDGWEQEVVNTLTRWVEEMKEQYTIYSILQDGLIESAERYSVSALVLSSILTFINVLKYILETTGDVEKIFGVGIALISFFTLLSTGMSKIKNTPRRIQSNSAYMADIHRFVEMVKTEKQKPQDIRRNARQFVHAIAEFRSQISNSMPEITFKEKMACLKIKQASKKELIMTRSGSIPVSLSNSH